MADATTFTFSKVIVELGDGATPEVFSKPCGFSSRSFRRSKSFQETALPDCDDEDAASVVLRDVISKDWSCGGEGVLAEESLEAWDAFYEDDSPKNVRVSLIGQSETIRYVGPALLESLEIGAQKGPRATLNASIQGAGKLVRTPAL
jgi:hypothetical protein